MRQTRVHTHDESHYDVEELFDDVWAVTKCNCKLLTKSEADMYDGYTESQAITEARAERLFTDYKTHFQLKHTTEQDADDLAALVDVVNASTPLDWYAEAIALEADAQDWQNQITELRGG